MLLAGHVQSEAGWGPQSREADLPGLGPPTPPSRAGHTLRPGIISGSAMTSWKMSMRGHRAGRMVLHGQAAGLSETLHFLGEQMT